MAEQNDVKGALGLSRLIVTQQPTFLPSLRFLGQLLNKDKLPEAIRLLSRAVELDPSHGITWNELGIALAQQSDQTAALSAFEKAVRLTPDQPSHKKNLSRCLKALGRYDLALAIWEEVKDTATPQERASWNEPKFRLLIGDYARGWPLYEGRWGDHEIQAVPRRLSSPRWKGEDIADARLLVHDEQGVGDHLFFLRYLYPLLERLPKAQIVLEAPHNALDLTKGAMAMTRRVEVVQGPSESDDPNHVAARHDLHVPLGSLPLIFETRLDTIPSPAHYLRVRNKRRTAGPGEKQIGLSWYSSNSITGQKRSLKLTDLTPWGKIAGLHFLDLQYGKTASERAAAAQAGLNLYHDDSVDPLTALLPQAELIAGCDLVITIDNTVAHLAGALGVPTWLLLPWVPDWRWLLQREDSPWYPSLKLYRQPKEGDWAAVLARVNQDLALFAQGRTGPLKAKAWKGPPAGYSPASA